MSPPRDGRPTTTTIGCNPRTKDEARKVVDVVFEMAASTYNEPNVARAILDQLGQYFPELDWTGIADYYLETLDDIREGRGLTL